MHPPLSSARSATRRSSARLIEPLVSKQILRILFSAAAFSRASRAASSAWASCGVGSPPKKQMQLVFASTAAASSKALWSGAPATVRASQLWQYRQSKVQPQ